MSPRVGLDLHTILLAAAEIADKDGIEGVTLASLAKKLNVRPPSLYNHVDGLKGLRKNLAYYGIMQLHSMLKQATNGLSGDDAVRRLGEAYVAFARDHPGLYEATLRAPDPQDLDVQREGSEVVNLCIHVLDAYDLEKETAIHVVRGFRSVCHGFVSLERKGGFGLPYDLDVTFSQLMNIFIDGILTMKQKKKLT